MSLLQPIVCASTVTAKMSSSHKLHIWDFRANIVAVHLQHLLFLLEKVDVMTARQRAAHTVLQRVDSNRQQLLDSPWAHSVLKP